MAAKKLDIYSKHNAVIRVEQYIANNNCQAGQH